MQKSQGRKRKIKKWYLLRKHISQKRRVQQSSWRIAWAIEEEIQAMNLTPRAMMKKVNELRNQQLDKEQENQEDHPVERVMVVIDLQTSTRAKPQRCQS